MQREVRGHAVCCRRNETIASATGSGCSRKIMWPASGMSTTWTRGPSRSRKARPCSGGATQSFRPCTTRNATSGGGSVQSF